jgi:hypothetical protein
MDINGRKFLDGGYGTGANNPSWFSFHEVREKESEGNVALICSIGTGILKDEKPFPTFKGPVDKLKTAMNYTVHIATDAEATHRIMKRLAGSHLYERFNVDSGIQDIMFDDCKITTAHKTRINLTLTAINEATEKYLEKWDVRERLETVAKLLVENRKSRAGDESRWRRAVTWYHYRCTFETCPERWTHHQNEEKLIQHLVQAHADVGFRWPTTTEKDRELLSKRIQMGKTLPS